MKLTTALQRVKRTARRAASLKNFKASFLIEDVLKLILLSQK